MECARAVYEGGTRTLRDLELLKQNLINVSDLVGEYMQRTGQRVSEDDMISFLRSLGIKHVRKGREFYVLVPREKLYQFST